MDELTARAAAHWNKVTISERSPRIRWWESEAIIRHINKRVCGEPLPGIHSGFHQILKARVGETLDCGISIGCGTGGKEMALVQAGVVREFHLYEISSERVRIGRANAIELGIEDRIHFYEEDAFAHASLGKFDLVYWNNALHHMLDTTAAVRWSREALCDGGYFAMDDFVGPSRFQWTDRSLAFVSAFRQSLPGQFLRLSDGKTDAPSEVQRPPIDQMIRIDPSEAADSDNIIPAIEKCFPSAFIQRTGGDIYHLGLSDILINFEEDAPELAYALVLDDAIVEMGERHYAVAIAQKI